MKSRAELNAIAAEDVLFKERLSVADDLVATTKALEELRQLLQTCATDEERANVQKAIDEGAEDMRKLGERLLFLASAPSVVGTA